MDSGSPFSPRPTSSRAHSAAARTLEKAMVELDDEQHMPEGVDTAVWQRLVDARKQKVESEQQVKERGLISIRRKCFCVFGMWGL